MIKAAIIGFGRFGELLANISKNTFDLSIVESNQKRRELAITNGFKLLDFNSVAESELIFLAVPISEIENTVERLSTVVDKRHTVIDLCSVKVYPAQLMQKYLTKSDLLAAHPMFGPDSAKDGLEGLQVAFCPLRIAPSKMQVVKQFWEKLGATVIVTTPEQHDKDAVYSQAFTYSMAQIILQTNLPPVNFRTRSFDSLARVAELSANDSEQLFHDMLFYNPYYSSMKTQLQNAISSTMQKLDAIEAEQNQQKPF